ncbi:NAD(P)-binding domain-containing protein [Devosia sp. J2-20]|uniref:L-threonate dehydrogenase n=1 Tax=Devosia sp. J2-20 TaxID=3026161 RepID=UPI00249C8893|nr:L-threonate dehydrogenase [Devosia sp. J2-20]WDQ98605.1 NAD(P)-binding domain-containing protein [Devosia sp. J2-20]
MTETTSLAVAMIGLGSMGLGMAKSLLASGHTVSGYDVTASATAALGDLGARACTSPADAAKGAQIAVVVVVNAAQTEAVLFGDNGIVPAMVPGGVVISCATMAPDAVRALAERCSQRDIHYLDAPMSGGAARAGTGELTFMASGSPHAFAVARPALDAMAGKVYELGEAPGIGASFKIVNQLLAGVHIAAACEAITFASKLGLDIDKVYEVITASAGNSWMFENRVPHILEGDYAPKSAVNIFTKDLGIVSDIGRTETFPLPIAASALQLFLATAAAGMGRDDDASPARLIAQITGIKLPQTKEH